VPADRRYHAAVGPRAPGHSRAQPPAGTGRGPGGRRADRGALGPGRGPEPVGGAPGRTADPGPAPRDRRDGDRRPAGRDGPDPRYASADQAAHGPPPRAVPEPGTSRDRPAEHSLV